MGTQKKQKGLTLVIVESPAKARTLERYLGSGFKVMASVGHVKDLPKSSLGVDVEHDFKPEYVPIKGRGNVLRDIRKMARQSDRVLLAPDPDREGEAIAWHIAQELKRSNKDIQRILIHEITRGGVKKAMSHLLPLNQRRFESQQARRILDRLVGYQISPLLWDKVRRGLSAGRVQSVAVRLVVDREQAIRDFVPEEFWTFTASLRTQGGKSFQVKLVRRKGKKLRVGTEARAMEVRAELMGAAWIVARMETKEQKKTPPPPFITAKLQQEASRLLRFSPKRTMSLAQSLYQGIELGEEGPVGLITYMRTDSTRVSEEALGMARETILERFGEDFLPAGPRRFRSRKGAQDAHEAIRPTSTALSPDEVAPHLDRDQLRLYRLIYNRFLASQMAEARYDRTQIDVQAAELEFQATGRMKTFAGYTRIYSSGQDADEERSEGARDELPRLSPGEELDLEELLSDQQFTPYPPRFTEASLVKELEERGIGRPSTYAAIISNIQERDYVRKAEGRFGPTELGSLVTGLLVDSFPKILGVEFTAKLESQLDKVEEGEVDWLTLLREFYDPFSRTLAHAQKNMRDVKREEIPTDIDCDRCSRKMVIRWGKNGSFLACSGYPECRNTKELERDEQGKVRIKPPELSDEPCPECGRPMVIKNGRFGRFLACCGYPDCKKTQPISLGVACPRPGCGGELNEKRSRRGRVFYSCSRYPECDYALWDRPIPEPCPDCKHPFLLFKQARTRGRNKSPEHIACPACDYKREP